MDQREYQREYQRSRRAAMSPEEQEVERQKNREYNKRRPPMTAEQRQVRNAKEAARRAERIAAMTPEQRAEKRAKELAYSRKRRAEFPEESRELVRRSRKRVRAAGGGPTPDQLQKYHRKYKYGLTDTEWQALFTAQGNRCAICGETDPPTKNKWHTDHCHKTGRVRGILCHYCNAIVHKHATAAVLRRAAEYVESNS